MLEYSEKYSREFVSPEVVIIEGMKAVLELLIIISTTAIIIPTTIYAQPAEDPEHNLKGKLDMIQDVIQDVVDACGEKVEVGGPVWDAVETDCFKVIGAVNSSLSKVLIDNKESIDHILYGG